MTTDIYDTDGFPVFNLIEQSLERGYNKRFNEFKEEHNVLNSSTLFPGLEVGDVVSFVSGYDSNIRYVSKILGFDSLGWAYVLWDCYWVPLNLESRNYLVFCDARKY